MARFTKVVVAVTVIAGLMLTAVPARSISVAPFMTGSFSGFPYDRVQPGDDAGAFTPDGTNDALFALTLHYTATHTIEFMRFSDGLGNAWTTVPGDGLWDTGITGPLADSPFFVHQPSDGLGILMVDDITLWAYLPDSFDNTIGNGHAIDVLACYFDDGCVNTTITTATASGDLDGDGYDGSVNDCDDADASIHPGAVDVPDDGVDQDCDGGDLKTWYIDSDGDHFGDPSFGLTALANEQPEGYIADNTDCDDTDGLVYPGRAEIGEDGTDQDCDGVDAQLWYQDQDEDTYGNPGTEQPSNDAPGSLGWSLDNTDCNDNTSEIYPGAPETPDDGVDQDCDGLDAHLWHADSDDDGYGDRWSEVTANDAPSGYIAEGTDCDDTSSAIHPGATEVLEDGVDQDCDGLDLLDLYFDTDVDGYGDATRPFPFPFLVLGLSDNSTDCNDTDDAINPAATEIPGNGVDEDCDGADGGEVQNWYADIDGDTFGDAGSSVSAVAAPTGHVADATDCDDTDAGIFPGATEITDNGTDEDCDGADLRTWYADADADAFGNAGSSTTANDAPAGHVADATDCDDSASAVHPGATEIADNGTDEDCDGADLRTWYADSDADTFGDAGSSATANSAPTGHVANSTDCDDTSDSVHPGATEVKDNGVDENCDGFDLRTWYADVDADTFGNAASSTAANAAPTGHVANSTDCNDAAAAIHPGATEITDNGTDEDCDGFDLRTWYADADFDGYGNPNSSTTRNTQPTGYTSDSTDCNDSSSSINPGATEINDNGVDENCDGIDGHSNRAPQASGQAVNTPEDTFVVVTLSATDADDDNLAFAIVSNPTHGTLGSLGAPNCSAVNTCTATVRYTPSLNYNGGDAFTFRVTDSHGAASASPGTVTITVTAVADATSLILPPRTTSYLSVKSTRVTISTTVSSTDPACTVGRPVTFTITGASLTSPLVLVASSTSKALAEAAATLANGTYNASISAAATSACASANVAAGSFVISSPKKVK